MVKSRATVPRRTARRRAEIQRMAEMIDHATEAKRLAETLGEKFLAYLLAMVILEMSHVKDTRGTRDQPLEGTQDSASESDSD